MANQKRPLPGLSESIAEPDRTIYGFLGAKVTNSIDETIPNDEDTVLTFDTDVFDTDGFHTSSPNSRLAARRSGYYLISGNVAWESANNGERRVDIVHSVDGVIASVEIPASPGIGENTREYIAVFYYMAKGEYVYLNVWQDTGGPLDIIAAPYSPTFSIGFLGV